MSTARGRAPGRALARGLLAALLLAAPATMPAPPAAAGDAPPARALFGALSRPSAQRPEAFGGYARGCLAGAVQLPETGPTWQAMRLSRNRRWGHPELIAFIERLSRRAARLKGWKGIYVGDMAQPRGGPMKSGHRSHQSGLDADIWLRPATRLDLSRAARERLPAISMRRDGGARVNGNWTVQQMQLLRAAAEDDAVARIFIFPGAKVWICERARGDRRWLRKLRPWWGHHYHFHVRLRCPEGSPGCANQPDPPPGDGCDEARQWVHDILNPPPPDPTPKPPRPPLLMKDLPRQCASVLHSP